MEFAKNDWGQRYIINKTRRLTKRVSDTIHDVNTTKHQKYPSNTVLKNMNVLDKVNKFL